MTAFAFLSPPRRRLVSMVKNQNPPVANGIDAAIHSYLPPALLFRWRAPLHPIRHRCGQTHAFSAPRFWSAPGNQLHSMLMIGADQTAFHTGRIRKRSDNIKNTPPQFRARFRSELHCRMIQRGKEKSDAIRLIACCTVSVEHWTFHPQCVSTSRCRFDLNRTIAMLGDRDTRTAATNDAIVEMLNVPEQSPPVPAHINCFRIFDGNLTPCSRIVRAKRRVHPLFSPFARRAIIKPAIWESVACPVMMVSSAFDASATVRCSPDKHFSM